MQFFETETSSKFSVSEITNLIKVNLESNFKDIIVEGEISNYRPASSGHIYFAINDKESQLNCALFKYAQRNSDLKLKDGDKIKAYGSISVYKQRGSYQLIVNRIEKCGEGDILAILEERKKMFAQKGYFEQDKKLPLPKVPKTVAVITSHTGAAIRDIINVISRRNATINLKILSTAVQGDGAGKKIAKRIKQVNQHNIADVIIIGRGGGSLEDLLPFSEIDVIEAIAESKIPVISAVGHEIDWAISDYVADMRAPTPSAAAEIVTSEQQQIADSISNYKDQILNYIQRIYQFKRLRLEQLSEEQLKQKILNIYTPIHFKLEENNLKIANSYKKLITNYRHKLQISKLKLEKESPLYIMGKGYTIITDKESGKAIKYKKNCMPNQKIEIHFKDGKNDAVIL